jgi:hypothetical protein
MGTNLETVMTVVVPPFGIVTVRKDSNPLNARIFANSLCNALIHLWVRSGSTTFAYLLRVHGSQNREYGVSAEIRRMRNQPGRCVRNGAAKVLENPSSTWHR